MPKPITQAELQAAARSHAARKAKSPERPKWVLDTPMMYYALEAYVTDLGCEPLRITLTIEEFDILKTHLAKMRGYVVTEVAHAR